MKVDNSLKKITDMPKLHSPFVRENKTLENGKKAYVVTPKIEEDYSWVFEDDRVLAVEKLHGTNVSVVVKNGVVDSIWNRSGRVTPFVTKNKNFIVRGLLTSFKRGYLELEDGQWFGEVVGEKLHGNPYGLDGHLWIPFRRLRDKLHYTSWGRYPKTFESISEWFKNLLPLFYSKTHRIDFSEAQEKGFVEGVVFTHPDGRMAKLRRDMFDWFYLSKEEG